MGYLLLMVHTVVPRVGLGFCMRGIGNLGGVLKNSWVYRGATLIFEGV